VVPGKITISDSLSHASGWKQYVNLAVRPINRLSRSLQAILVLMAFSAASGQAITGFNLNYLYDPDAEVSLQLKPVRQGRAFMILYRFTANRKEYDVSGYDIQWEKRATVNTRSGDPSGLQDSLMVSDNRTKIGAVFASGTDRTWYLVAKVTNRSTRGIWNFVTSIEPNWPGVFYLKEDQSPVTGSALTAGRRYTIGNFPSTGKLYGYHYRKPFSPAAPPFVSGVSTDRFIGADSTFILTSPEFVPSAQGLYLLQSDTTAASGLSVFAGRSPYPRFNTIQSLTGPLLYLTTADEQAELEKAGAEKSRFDKVVIGITRDTDRAKSFMRSYYQRVEEANRYFTGYKEGWRTDMGMVYLIFGVPTEVSRTATTEIWFYKGTSEKFLFNRTGSVFAPANYFLQRSDSYTPSWYSMVDLWRKARF